MNNVTVRQKQDRNSHDPGFKGCTAKETIDFFEKRLDESEM